jgi:hypothetical protein
VLDPDGAAQDDRVLVEVGALVGLAPAGRRAHPGHAQALLAVARAAGEFLDLLRRLACGFDPHRGLDQLGHRRSA